MFKCDPIENNWLCDDNGHSFLGIDANKQLAMTHYKWKIKKSISSSSELLGNNSLFGGQL